jgi:hypothetical protein
MKHARINGILYTAAALLALSAGASAQLVRHEGLASRPRTATLERELTLTFKMRPRAGTDPLAVMPLQAEMIRTLELSNGTPGGVAVIHLGTHELELRGGGAGRVQLAGFFDEDGVFSFELPADTDVAGLFATGAEVSIAGHRLAKANAGGARVPERRRPEMDVERIEAQRDPGLFAGQDTLSIAGKQLDKKSAGGAAVPERKRPEMDVERIEAQRDPGLFAGQDTLSIAGKQLVKKSAGGAAVPERKRPEMDVERIEAQRDPGLFAGQDTLSIAGKQLVKKSIGGAAVPASERPEMDLERDALDLGAESEVAYAKWWKTWTKLQLGNDHRL